MGTALPDMHEDLLLKPESLEPLKSCLPPTLKDLEVIDTEETNVFDTESLMQDWPCLTSLGALRFDQLEARPSRE